MKATEIEGLSFGKSSNPLEKTLEEIKTVNQTSSTMNKKPLKLLRKIQPYYRGIVLFLSCVIIFVRIVDYHLPNMSDTVRVIVAYLDSIGSMDFDPTPSNFINNLKS